MVHKFSLIVKGELDGELAHEGLDALVQFRNSPFSSVGRACRRGEW